MLTVRLTDRELSIKAPARFLRALFDWCDGTRNLSDIETLADARLPGSRFKAFVEAMLECGVLTDSRFSALHALAEVRRSRDQGGRVDSQETSRACATDASHAIAGDFRLNEGVLAKLLGALHGTGVSSRSLRMAVMLRESVDGLRPGIFRAVVSRGGAALRPIGSLDESALLGAMASPYVIARSAGVLAIFAGEDPTLQGAAYPADLVWMAAGAAMQRVYSCATALGLRWQSTPVHDPERLRILCDAGSLAFVGAAVFGESHSTAHEPRITSRWLGGADLLGHRVAEVSVSSADKAGIGCGKAKDARLACAIAVSEAVERYSFCSPPADILRSEGHRLSDKLDPERLVRFSDDQYRREHATLAPYDDDMPRLWIAGKDLDTDAPLWVPADCAYHGAHLPTEHDSRMLMRQTSSGCASDISLTTALQRAGLEIVERDAFARHWLAQQPGVGLRSDSLPTGLAQRVDAIEAQGCEVDACVLQAGFGPAVLVAITSHAKGLCMIATACGNSAESSLDRALTEAETATLARLASTARPRIAARAVSTPLDHATLYAQRRHYRKAHAIARGARTADFAEIERAWPASLAARLPSKADGPRAAWVDLTRHEAPLSLDGQPIRTVRMLLPGAVPIAFGYDALPRGMGAASVASGRFPHPLP